MRITGRKHEQESTNELILRALMYDIIGVEFMNRNELLVAITRFEQGTLNTYT